MKANSIFFTTLTLAAPLAFLLQASALAQADGATNTPPPPQDAAANAPASQSNVEFFFPGGTPDEFLSAVEKQYKVDWKKVADIPDNMRFVHIPALRMNQQSSEQILGFRGGGARSSFSAPLGGGGGGSFGAGGASFSAASRQGSSAAERNLLNALIVLYNSLEQAKPELGRLTVEGDLAKPSVVIFHSSPANRASDVKMKTFALKGIPENEWGKLEQELNEQFAMLDALNQRVANTRGGQVNIHKDTGLLVVFGRESSYLEAAESLVIAWHANHPPAPPPTAPKP